MNVRMLKKDLRRKKSINLILLVFIFLSTMFIAGSLNNFTRSEERRVGKEC